MVRVSVLNDALKSMYNVEKRGKRQVMVELNGRLNKCGVISPRFDAGVKEIEPWTTRLLPSRQFGYIVLTTSAGIMDHEEARRKNVGGKVLGFFY
ncbi:small ribosomal subunit protein uS8-like [Cornus florida]|uniref:small ribosomal subunit protein uS8-like n=1 Tax=Cornus florida TaxID=4283 RepID=UPI002898AE0A|nr:small ribosomal subunit protein uS8-like [Cornus florida]